MRHLLSALAAAGALGVSAAAEPPATPPSVPATANPVPSTTPAMSTPSDAHSAPRDIKHYNLSKDKLAIDGYDPVAYFPEGGGKPAEGRREFTHTHRGVTYRFATQANLDAFKKNPEKYEPAYGGWCASAIAKGGRKVEIDPKAFKITNSRLFLFYTDLLNDARTYWNQAEAKNTDEADKNWKKIAAEDPRKPADKTAPPPAK